MRTINDKMFARLTAQAEEARTLKMTKLANHLHDEVQKVAVRPQRENYTYTDSEMRTDVERALWDAMIRAADYFGAPFDAVKVQKVIDKMAEDLIDEVRVIVGNDSGVGPYDVPVPGERPEQVMFELEISDE